MNIFLRRIAGTKKYRVSCSDPSRICGKLMAEFSQAVFAVKVESESSFIFSCITSSSKKINLMLKDYGCEITELAHIGLPYFLAGLRRRPGLVFGCVLILAVIIYSHNIVWDIEITGNRRIGAGEIENTLQSVGFEKGKPYKSERLASICNKFIIKDDRFTRISINMSGNKAFVEVTERTKKNSLEAAPSESGIISQYDCIIERPEVLSGTSLVKKGDVIEKGAVLISPIENGTNGNEYIAGAKGKIYAKTVESFTVTVPFDVLALQPTGETYKDYSVSFLGMTGNFADPFKKAADNYLYTSTRYKARLYDYTELPFTIEAHEKKGYITEEMKLTAEQAENKAYEIMYSKISRDLTDCEILSTEFEISRTDEYLTLCCIAECIRDVTQMPDK